MGMESSGGSGDHIIGGIEHELTIRLERAHELSERAQRSNNAVQHEIDRALEIADRLRGRLDDRR